MRLLIETIYFSPKHIVFWLSVFAFITLVFLWPNGVEAAGEVTLTDPATTSCTLSNPQASLTWTTTLVGSPNYFVLRRLQGGAVYTEIAGPITDTFYGDNTIVSDQSYEYQIRAEQGVDTFFSNEVVVPASYCKPELTSIVASCLADGPHITVGWSAISGDLLRYEVYRDGVKVVETTDTNFDDGPNIEAGISYSYFVRSIWQDLTSADSDPASQEALACPVIISSNAQCTLTLTPGGPRVDLLWNSLLGVTSYQIYRQAQSEATFSLLDTVTTTSYTDDFVDSLATYAQGGQASYYVKAIWPADQSDSATAVENILQCAPFLAVQSDCDLVGFKLSWTATQGATQYNIYKDDIFQDQVAASSLFWPLTGVDGTSATATHKYRVDANVVPPLASNEVTASIDCTITDPPSPVPVLQVPYPFCDTGDSRIQLDWSASNNVNYYTVYRTSGASTTGFSVGGTSYPDPGLESGIQYTYYVLATGPGGETDPAAANTETVTAVSCTLPSTPDVTLSTQCAAGNPSVTVSWTSDDGNTLSYEIHRGTTSGSLSPIITFNQTAPEFSSKTWTDTTVVPSQTYYYQVIANGPTGVTPSSSSEASITTQSCLPTTPSLSLVKSCQLGNAVVDLSWSTNEANTDSYEIFRDDFMGGATAIHTIFDTSIKDWSDTSVAQTTLYNYKVDAVGPVGRSTEGYSAITTDSCVPPGPFILNLDTPPFCHGPYLSSQLSWTSAANADSYDLTENRLDVPGSVTYSDVATPFTDLGFGNALDFDGDNDRVEIPNTPSLDYQGNTISITAWMKRSASLSNDSPAICKGPDSNEERYILGVNNGTELNFRITTTDDYERIDAGFIPPDQWVHVAGTYDGDGSIMTVYINGVVPSGGTDSQTGNLLSDSSPIYIGKRCASDSRYFEGQLDEIRVYDRALSQVEIQDQMSGIYNETGVIGSWGFDEDSGTTLSDSSNNGNDGALTSMDSATDWVPHGPQNLGDYTWQAEAFGIGGSTPSNTTASVTAPMCEPPKPGLFLIPLCEPGVGPVVDLQWSYSMNTTAYEAYREEGAIDTLLATTVSQTVDPSLRTVTDDNGGPPGLAPLTSYSYYVAAKPIGAFPDVLSDTITVTTLNCIPPTQPQNVGATFECSPERNGVLGGTTSVETTDPGWFIPGQVGGALDFNEAEGDYVSVSEPSLPTGDFTYAAWVNLDNTSDEMIVMASNGSGGNEFFLQVDSGQLRMYLDGSQAAISAGTIPTGSWRHVAATRSGNAVQLYINGVPDGSGTRGNIMSFSSCPLFIGTDVDSGCSGGLSNFLDGRIDEVHIYNRALTISEIDEVRQNIFADTRNLMAYWSFEEAAGQIAFNNTLGSDPVGRVTWEDSDDATSYTVYRDDGATFGPIADDDSAVYTYDDDTIAVDTAYSYTVQAFGPGGSGLMSDPSIPSIGVGNYCRPYFPTIGSAASACVGSIPENTITWSDSSTINTTDYNVYRTTTDNAPDNPADLIATVPVGTSVYLDNSGLSNLTIYYYWVEAVRVGAPDTSLSPAKSIATPGCGIVPSAPTNLAVDTLACLNNIPTATLSWTDGAPAYSHKVFRDNPDATTSVYSTRISAFTDRGGYALDFVDSLDQSVVVPHIPDYLMDSGSVELWFNVDDFNDDYGLFSKDSSGYDTGGHLTISVRDSSEDVRARLQAASFDQTIDSSAITAGDWHHVVFTFGSQGMKLYVDGSLEDTDSYTGGLGTTSGGAGNFEPFTIGAATWGSGNQTASSTSAEMEGMIDDVRFYNRELSLPEVTEHLAGIYNNESGLVGAWHFDEGAGITAFDSSGLGNDGAPQNGPTWTFLSSADPSYVVSLESEQPYTYYVKAFGLETESASSNQVPITALDCLPAKPDLTVDQQCSAGDSQLVLAWDPDSNTQYWSAYKRRVPVQPLFSFLANTTITSITDTNVESGITYEYYVDAIGEGVSTLSDVISQVAPFCVDPPSTPVISSTQAVCFGTSSRIQIDWGEDATGNTLSFEVFRKNLTLGETIFSPRAGGLSPSTVQYPDFVDDSNDYVYKIRGVGAGANNFSDSAESATVTGLDCSSTPPNPPTLFLEAVVSTGDVVAVSLRWTDAGNEQDTGGYRLFRSSGASFVDISGDLGFPGGFDGNTIPADVFQVDNGVVDNQSYTYRVYAYNAFAPYDSANPLLGGIASNDLAVPVPTARPGDFTLSGVPIAGDISLDWTPAAFTAAGGAVEYTVYRSDTAAFSTQPVAGCENLSTLVCNDTASDSAEPYYRVTATNAGGLNKFKCASAV